MTGVILVSCLMDVKGSRTTSLGLTSPHLSWPCRRRTCRGLSQTVVSPFGQPWCWRKGKMSILHRAALSIIPNHGAEKMIFASCCLLHTRASSNSSRLSLCSRDPVVCLVAWRAANEDITRSGLRLRASWYHGPDHFWQAYCSSTSSSLGGICG